MSQIETGYVDEYSELSRTRVVANILIFLSIAVAVVTPIFLIMQWGVLVAPPDDAGERAGPAVVNASQYLGLIWQLTLGWGAAALLWAIAEIMRRMDDLPDALREAGGGNGSSFTALGGGRIRELTEAQQATLTEMAVLLREVRDISMLTQEERTLRLSAQAAEAVRELQKTVPELLRSHNWVEARRRVQVARERFPSQSEWDGLEQRIEEVRASVEAQDVEAARRQINDLAALGAWERAFDVVHDLLERHPECEPARQLAQFVKDERSKADAEQRLKLMAQVQDSARRREWSAAVSAANALIKQYPNSQEARALRIDLPTLMENAEIQTRKRLEQEITDLSKARRFDEALALARDLIDRYPNSPQAAVLRDKLPQLEARASARSFR